MTLRELERHATEVRLSLLHSIVRAGGGHTGGSLSSVDILVALYFKVMHIDPENPGMDDRDRFIMSKGHSVESLHAVLCKRGFFGQEVLDSYGQFGSILAGHPTRNVPGVEVNSGALGHGLSIGTGIALAARRDGKDHRCFVLMGDGEQGEGSLLEAAAAAGHYRLDNLVAIIDRNRLQISGKTEEVMKVENLEAKYAACAWSVTSCDGHDKEALLQTLDRAPFEPGKPSLIIAQTIKGKGVSFMEDRPEWHHKVPSPEQLEEAEKELMNKLEELKHGEYTL